MKNDHRSKFSNLSNWKEEAWKKKSGPQRDSNPWPPRCRCVAPPTELWSKVNLLSSYLPWGVKWCEVYETIHFWTAVVDESEEYQSFERNSMKINDQQRLESLEYKIKCGAHADMVSEGFANVIAKATGWQTQVMWTL